MPPGRFYRSQVASKSSRMLSDQLLGAGRSVKTSKQRNSSKNYEIQQVGHMLPRAVRTRPKRPGELSKWLQHCLQRRQDGSKTAQGASKTPLIRLQDRSKSSQDASRTIPRAPRRPLRLAKGLQVGSGSFQDASRSSPEEPLALPRPLQELPRGDSRVSSCLQDDSRSLQDSFKRRSIL